MKTALQILIDGRAVIALPECWTQGVLARDVAGRGVSEHSPRAVCFCSRGALNRTAMPTDWSRAFDSAFDALNTEMEFDVIRFNDRSPHAEVLAAWDRAIVTCRGAAA